MDFQAHRDHCFGEKSGGKRPFRRPSSIWEDNITMNLQGHRDHCFDEKTWGKETP